MKIKGQIIVEVKEEKEFIEENDFEDKDSVLSYLLDNAENFVNQEGVNIEISNVSWITQPKDENFENKDENEDEDEDEKEETE